MKNIDSYLSTLFSEYPPTPAFKHAKKRLRLRMKKRLKTLIKHGKTPSEAQNIVIAEHNSLEALADELNIAEEIISYRTGKSFYGIAQPMYSLVTQECAQKYSQALKESSAQRATGTIFFILGLAFFLLCISICGEHHTVSIPLATVGLILCIVIGRFLLHRVKKYMSPFSMVEEYGFMADPAVKQWVHEQEQEQKKHARSLKAAGVLLIATSPIGVIAPAILTDNHRVSTVGLILLLCMVAAGVWIIIFCSWATRAADTICVQSQDWGADQTRSTPLLHLLRKSYWGIVIIIFLLWGFSGNLWAEAWIVFPVAAILCCALDRNSHHDDKSNGL
ncbi:hypothetical protein ACN08Z_03505 [Rothia sp. P7181]|uniref:hypothetical protein n=1 Tax=Rothia sp. P7181 TaxID=3402663 RepID=UPI003ADD66FE